MFRIFMHGKLGLIVMTASLLLSASAYAAPLLLCGADEVFLIDTDQAAKGTIQKLWSWRAKDHEEIPQELRGGFANTTDCKPVNGGTRILISSNGGTGILTSSNGVTRILTSSSSGAAALVEYPSGHVLWYAHVPNSHSLELLPKDRIIAASSHAGDPHDPTGNALILFDIAKPDQPLWETPFPWAHGVVWDATRQRLWALGAYDLRCYELKDWETDKPSLQLQAAYPLPELGGHDLQAMPGGNDLVVTTVKKMYLFDRETLKFHPHPDLAGKLNVKSISINPDTGRVAYICGESEEHWWSTIVHLLAPDEDIKLPNDHLYKGRWMPEAAGAKGVPGK